MGVAARHHQPCKASSAHPLTSVAPGDVRLPLRLNHVRPPRGYASVNVYRQRYAVTRLRMQLFMQPSCFRVAPAEATDETFEDAMVTRVLKKKGNEQTQIQVMRRLTSLLVQRPRPSTRRWADQQVTQSHICLEALYRRLVQHQTT